MNDQELERLVAASAPIRDHDLAPRSLPGTDDLREAIMSNSLLDTDGAEPAPRLDGPGASGRSGRLRPISPAGGRRSVRPGRRVALVVALAAAVIVGVVVVQTPDDRARHSAWAAPLVQFAERSPLLLVAQDGWAVTRADEADGQNGEMTFSRRGSTIELRWRPGSQHAEFVDDRSHGARELAPVTIAGHRARLFLYEGSAGDYTALWLQDGHSVELRGRFTSEQGYRAMAATVRTVDVDTWLSAMPASAVKPVSRAAAVRRMLADLPVPRSVDVAALETGSNVSDQYQLGVHVVGAVACGWIEQWITAKAAGDVAKVKEAAAALEGSHRWSVLKTMQAEGDYGQFVWEYADAVALGRPGFDGPLDIAATYRDALGCH